MIGARICTALALSALLPLGAVGNAAAQTSRVPTVTRLVKLFTELELRLAREAHASDPAALEQLLDSEFEMRAGPAAGTPVPRDEWIRQVRATAAGDARIDQMAVHDFGEIAVVSFREAYAANGRRPPRAARFVVDCWKRASDGWKLAVRYESDVASSTAVKATPKTIDKRY